MVTARIMAAIAEYGAGFTDLVSRIITLRVMAITAINIIGSASALDFVCSKLALIPPYLTATRCVNLAVALALPGPFSGSLNNQNRIAPQKFAAIPGHQTK